MNRPKLALNSSSVGENIRIFIRWLSSVHAPLGRWAPLAGAGLLTSTRLFHSGFLRALAYSASAIFAILIASDIAHSFIDPHAFPEAEKESRSCFISHAGCAVSALRRSGQPLQLPDLCRHRIIDAAHFLAVIFLACCFIGWRNVSLWYKQGEQFEEALAEATSIEFVADEPNIG